jgi:hypothetical protein
VQFNEASPRLRTLRRHSHQTSAPAKPLTHLSPVSGVDFMILALPLDLDFLPLRGLAREACRLAVRLGGDWPGGL